MTKLVNVIEKTLVIIMTLFTSFILGILFSIKIFEKEAERINEASRKRNRNRVSYCSYYDRQKEES